MIFLHGFCAFVCSRPPAHFSPLRRRKELNLGFFPYKKRYHSLQILLLLLLYYSTTITTTTYMIWYNCTIVPFLAEEGPR